MDAKLGFIGCGNMARAIMGGIIKSGLLQGQEVIASNTSRGKLEKAAAELGIRITDDNKEVAAASEVLVLAVKPQFYPDVIREVASVLPESAVVVSIAPGITLQKLGELFGKPVKLIRTMPNTPAMVGEGMTAVCCNELVSGQELETVRGLFASFGKAEIIKEYMMDAVIAASGSSPAYVFLFIEALADAAVMGGLPRDKAYRFAAQAVLGSAKMVLETGMHPGALKDMVCSPAGTTIEAVRVLEEKGLRGSVIEACRACMDKSKALG